MSVNGDVDLMSLSAFPTNGPHGPFVLAQLGQSLDGRIATVSGESRYINSAGALDHLHTMRARVDAVIVGVSTVVADDPLLTVRRVEGTNPARIILDPHGRLPINARCLRRDGTRVCIVTSAEFARAATFHADIIELPADGGIFDPQQILTALHARGFNRVLVEGGSATISRFLDADCVDRLHVLVSPLIIGSGKSGLELSPIGPLANARRPSTQITLFGDGDVLFDCDLRNLTAGHQKKRRSGR